MPRKSMTDEKHSPIVRFRVDKETQAIIAGIKSSDGNISEFIRDKLKQSSTLEQKFFNLFKEVTAFIPENTRITFIDNLNESEKQRIKELASGGSINE